MKTTHARSHTGWNESETKQLLQLSEQARKDGCPLRWVFETFSSLSGRQPNSVRNYYYALVKQPGEAREAHSPAFMPFTPEESELLVEAVLSAQAKGESVRACTLRLGGGSDKAMLRYQNKYRSLINGNPELVRSVLEDMRRRGVPAADPYAPGDGRRRVGRPRKLPPLWEMPEGVSSIVQALEDVEGLDVNAFLAALGTLARSAVSGAQGRKRAAGSRDEGEAAAREEITRLRSRYDALVSSFRQLMRVNTEFLKLNAVVKVSNLSSYIQDLESNMRSCIELVTEQIPS